MTSGALDRLFDRSVVDRGQPDDVFFSAVSECLDLLAGRFPEYADFLERRSPGILAKKLESVEDLNRLPAIFLPILKHSQFDLPRDLKISLTLTSSGTSGRPSRIPLDEENMDRRVAAMRSMYDAMGIVSGPTRAMAFLIDPGTTQMAGSLVIDAVLRALSEVQEIRYLATMGANGPGFDPAGAIEALANAGEEGPVLCVGYPALMIAAIEEFQAAGVSSLPLPAGSLVLTGGGWKSFLPGVKIDRKEFRETTGRFFCLSDDAIRDMYGMAECPAVMVQCEKVGYHVPDFAYAQAIDPETGLDVPDGESGLLQLTTPLTTCYPLLKILTTDKIRIRRDCQCGLAAPIIIPLGRATAARYETCAMKIGRALPAG